MADDAVWVFVGLIIGICVGIPVGWVVAQIATPKGSTVIVQKLDNGYMVRET